MARSTRCNIGIEGRVTLMLLDEDNRVVEKKQHHNVWTTVGREYQIGRMSNTTSIEGSSASPLRTDMIWYVGVGSGTQPISATVQEMVTPVIIDGTNYLQPVQQPFTNTVLATRYYTRIVTIFEKDDITYGGGPTSITLTEFGLFTNGHPAYGLTSWEYKGRTDNCLTNPLLACQYPIAYTCDTITKTDRFRLALVWELRS